MFIESGEIIGVMLTASNSFNVGMHLNLYELVWLKVSTMIGIVEHYILILV